jgi:hypothetical protein
MVERSGAHGGVICVTRSAMLPRYTAAYTALIPAVNGGGDATYAAKYIAIYSGGKACIRGMHMRYGYKKVRYT